MGLGQPAILANGFMVFMFTLLINAARRALSNHQLVLDIQGSGRALRRRAGRSFSDWLVLQFRQIVEF